MNTEHISKIKSRIKKIFSLSIKEILFRVRKQLQEQSEYLMFCCKMSKIPSSHIEYHDKSKVLFFTQGYDKNRRKEYIKRYCDLDMITEQAERILNGEVFLLGRTMQIPSGKGWHIDPVENIKWPNFFYSRVRNDKSVAALDIKFVWEINRHQYLIPLAKAFWLQGEEKYAKKVFDVICDWINANPYNTGVNWTSSLENAVRLFAWAWALYFCRDSVYFDKSIKKIKKSIYEQAFYIYKHLSIFSSPYNHLAGEAAALNLIGILFPEFKESEKWENIGWYILESGIENQFHSDGITVEQAFFYHHFTLGFYLQSIFLRKLNGKSVSKTVLNRIEKAIEISIYLSKPDGDLPMTGDIDNARSIYFTCEHSWNFSGFYALGAVLFNRSDFKQIDRGFLEEALWILDENSLQHYFDMQQKLPAETSKMFNKSGYCVIRDSWEKTGNYLCFDCGEIASGLSNTAIPSAAHGHADGLSFEMCAYGQPFIVDSGFFTYFGDIQWHKFFRHEEAHNTVHIEGYRQAEYCGRLKWQNVNKPEFMKWENSDNYTFCSGKIEYDKGVVHKRDIYYRKNDFWVIKDNVATGKKGRKIETYLNFHPDVDISIDAQKMEITAEGNEVSLLIKLQGNVKILRERGGDSPSSGWVCPGYGMRKSAWKITLSWLPEDNNHFLLLVFVPYRKNMDSVVFHGKKEFNRFNLKKNNNQYIIYTDSVNEIYVKKDRSL